MVQIRHRNGSAVVIHCAFAQKAPDIERAPMSELGLCPGAMIESVSTETRHDEFVLAEPDQPQS